MHKLENIAVTIHLAESLQERGFAIPATAISAGIENASHAGRLELWPGPPPLLFDGAHNVAGALALRQYLDSFVTTPITMDFGAMSDKDLAATPALLFPAATRVTWHG